MKTKHYISHHAIARLRERLKGSQHAKFTDDELRHLMDDAILSGTLIPSFDTRANADFSYCKLECFTDHLGGVPVAVLRDNNKNSGQPLAVATVFAESYVTKKLSTGEWTRPRINGIKGLDKIVGMMPDIEDDAICDVCQEVTCECPAPDPARPEPAHPVSVLITYKRKVAIKTVDHAYEEFAYEETPGRVAELVEDPTVVEGSIRLWREIPFATKREVRVEIGA